MGIKEASEFFKKIQSRTTSRREIKIYARFIGILEGLKNKELTAEQTRQIEEQLDHLQLTTYPENKKRYFNKRYAEFANYLKTEFSLVTEGYYTAIGISLGISFGAGMGIIFGTSFGGGEGVGIGISMGAGLGITFGILWGKTKDAEAEKNGNVLKTKIN